MIIGFAVGYILGAKGGPDGLAETERAWRAISSSDEVRDAVAGLLGIARDLARQAGGAMAHRLAAADGSAALKVVA